MPEGKEQQVRELAVAGHIFSASSTMVGICLTGIGLFRIGDRLKNISTMASELLAVNAAIFLVSCLFAYLALRTNRQERRPAIERVADGLFLLGLCLIALMAALLAYEFV